MRGKETSLKKAPVLGPELFLEKKNKGKRLTEIQENRIPHICITLFIVSKLKPYTVNPTTVYIVLFLLPSHGESLAE